MRIVSIGEVLWDIIGQAEYLGGAPFNFAAHVKRLGHAVFFISAVGADQRGVRILERMAEMGLSTRYVRRVEDQATGTVTVKLDSAGQPQFVIHRPAAFEFPQLSDSDIHDLFSEQPDWIYFGTLLQMSKPARELTLRLIDSARPARRFYDVNLRSDSYEPSLVHELMSLATVVQLNQEEASQIGRTFGCPHSSLEGFCRSYAKRFNWEAVCITQGAAGCALLIGDEYVQAKGYEADVVDTVGAGDAFAAAFVHGLGCGWRAMEIADFANRVGALVASRAGATPAWTIEETKAFVRCNDPRSHPKEATVI